MIAVIKHYFAYSKCTSDEIFFSILVKQGMAACFLVTFMILLLVQSLLYGMSHSTCSFHTCCLFVGCSLTIIVDYILPIYAAHYFAVLRPAFVSHCSCCISRPSFFFFPF